MTDYVWTAPVARKRHRCQMCGRVILPGESYQRMAGLDRCEAWTFKCCDHCSRVVHAWTRHSGESEWYEDAIWDWLADGHPTVYAAAQAGWRYPDGELVPLPFQPRCFTCGTFIGGDALWCPPCDRARIDRIARSLESISAELRRAS
ncbi:hypothetical protein DT076_16770 [Desertihabitans brevis]|uniref:Uncharacterized protein n=1 Tax=Desertihabitans brevis TaxID=2268447 RepID=A0A367YR76_9ACTN|nr:hypothetical protein [Desertihabitans brevis]RCK68300.1 hypothetical protein DT076_16770 [Desertihabitans brevis]